MLIFESTNLINIKITYFTKVHLKVKFLDWRYYYAVKKSIQALEQKKYIKRVYVIIDPYDRLVVVDRKAFREQKSKFKTLDRSLKMPDLRRNSIFYYPAYDTDMNYDALMESKKERYLKYFMK